MVGLCRLCASLRKTDVLITIKDNSNEICDQLLKCCQLDIMMEDGLPKSICRECIANLNISHKFYMKVQEAQDTLQALYPSQGCKLEHTSVQGTLLVQKAILEHIEQDASKDVNTQPKQWAKNVNEAHDEKKLEEMKRDGQEADFSQISTFEATFEILDTSDDIQEDLVAVKSPVVNIKVIDPEDREETEALENDDVQFNVGIPEEKYAPSNEVVQQINDLLSDDEINVEIEYMECLEDEDDENDEDADQQACEITRSPTHNALSIQEIQISSWKNYQYLCYICDSIFNSFTDLKTHIVEEHNVKQLDYIKYKCFDCRKLISRYSFFLNHVRARHHPALKLRCDACDLSCQTFDELTQHRHANCVEAKNFVYITACSYCFKSFHNAYGKQNHIKFQHASPCKVVYKCKICHKVFQYKSCLKAHERLHSDTKPFACDYCDKTFHTKLGLEQHLYVHVEEKVFLCNVCHRSYKTSKNLDDHRKLHTEEKAFKCQFCSKVFSRKIQKITHERTHTGEMPYSCEQCDKKFRYRSALFVHSKIHTGHKPYSCDYCEKTFSDSSNRNKHIRRMHSND